MNAGAAHGPSGRLSGEPGPSGRLSGEPGAGSGDPFGPLPDPDDFFSTEPEPDDRSRRHRDRPAMPSPTPFPAPSARAILRRQRRRRRRRIVVGTALLSAVTLATGTGYVYLRTRLDRIQRIAVPGLDADKARAPMNTLLVGSDAGEARIVMVLETDIRRRTSAVTSIPADLPLAGPGPGGGESATTIYARGGPTELVAALEPRLGAGLHHYVEVSLDEIGTIVDIVGGVAVTGAERRACDSLTGRQAVELLRGPPEPAVLGRQADLVAGTLAAALPTRPVPEPARFRRLLAEGVDEVVLDTTLSNRDLSAMAHAFTGTTGTVLRLAPAAVTGTAAATDRQARPEPADIAVRVLNGIRVDGAAARAAAALDTAGFRITGTASAGFPAFATTVRYAPGQRLKAQVLASRLQAMPQIGDEDPRLTDTDVSLVIGEDYKGLRTGPPADIPVEAAPAAGEPVSTRRSCA